jgi:hypothetical protein
MNTLLKGAILTILLLSGIFTLFAVEDFGAEGAKTDSHLTLEKMLTYAIQDEYLARAEYYMIMKEYGNIRPFSNIVKAEEYHVSLLVPLFEAYGLSVPADNAEIHLIMPDSIKRAVEIGVQAEIDNIAMYELFLNQDLPLDVAEVFQELKRASENHLNAFKRNLMKY